MDSGRQRDPFTVCIHTTTAMAAAAIMALSNFPRCNSNANGMADGGWRGRVTAVVASLAAEFRVFKAACAAAGATYGTHPTPIRRCTLGSLLRRQ